jgi:ribosomal protein S18 acetylase RimI-like enzyme
MSNDFRIRPASPADRAAVGRLWQELMDFHLRLSPKSFALAEDALEAWLRFLDKCLADEDHLVLVAEAGTNLVGYVIGAVATRPPIFKELRQGAIYDMCVAESWRRRGVGRRLCQSVLAWFRERELNTSEVSVSAVNPVSQAFWRAMGFEPEIVRMIRPLGEASNSG